MNKPIRIQRKRTKGWKMPENTIYVGRPSKWGNPFTVGMDIVEFVKAGFGMGSYPNNGFPDTQSVIPYYELWIKSRNYDLSELKGKNLACWCKLSEKCHADILLKLANE